MSANQMRLVVIVPFQNEETFLPRLLASIDRQTRLPDTLVLVDDGSSDASFEVAQRYASARHWVIVRSLPKRSATADRLAGAHELRAFQWAVAQLDEPWDVVAKLDADLELNRSHFNHLLELFALEPMLGIAGAHLSDVSKRGKLTRQPSPEWHVHGATKMYRRACYDAIQPIPQHLGWDMIDGAKARMRGWRTLSVSLPGGDTLHLRPTGSYNGQLRGFMRWGECAWRYGAHPLWILLGVAKRLRWKPYVLGAVFYGVGYVLAAARRLPGAEEEVVQWVRSEEVREVRNRLPLVARSSSRRRLRITSREQKKACPTVHFACSGGGHLDLLLRVRSALHDRKHVWIVEQSYRTAALREEGAEVHSLGAYHRTSPVAAIRTAWRTVRAFSSARPQLVVTAGAGIVVFYCLLARLAGAYIVFIETSARVRGPSSSGRILSRIADYVIVQWEEMARVYPGAVVARTSTLDEFADGSTAAGEGTFVGVGTQWQSFDRLIAMVDRASSEGHLTGSILFQVGHSSYSVRNGETRSYLTPPEMEDAIRNARYVICHAGVGTISSALRAGRRPLVLARLAQHGEHWDDHQQQIVDELARYDLVVPLGAEITKRDLEDADRPLVRPKHLDEFQTVGECLRRAIAGSDIRASP